MYCIWSEQRFGSCTKEYAWFEQNNNEGTQGREIIFVQELSYTVIYEQIYDKHMLEISYTFVITTK
jgi:hypothetical protein